MSSTTATGACPAAAANPVRLIKATAAENRDFMIQHLETESGECNADSAPPTALLGMTSQRQNCAHGVNDITFERASCLDMVMPCGRPNRDRPRVGWFNRPAPSPRPCPWASGYARRN